MGRPGKYESHVKPHLKEIEEMAQYMTEAQIAETLGVNYATFREYKKKYTALSSSLKKGRAVLVKDLKSTLIQRAKGFSYTEKKIIKEGGEVVREEIYQRSALPDVASLNLLLKNYASDWSNDPQTLELKKKELELKEKEFESKNW
jgi:hypothetical protein